MVRYQLSNLLLYKHELLLSKCPLTADWLLIRPVWNEISNEPLNYDPIPEHIISHTYCIPCLCVSPPASISDGFPFLPWLSFPAFPDFPHLTFCLLSFPVFFFSITHRVQLQWEIRRVRVWHGAVQEHWQRGALCELQRQHQWSPLRTMQGKSLQEGSGRGVPALQLQYQW